MSLNELKNLIDWKCGDRKFDEIAGYMEKYLRQPGVSFRRSDFFLPALVTALTFIIIFSGMPAPGGFFFGGITSRNVQAVDLPDIDTSRERFSLYISPSYARMEPEEINDMLEDVHDWGKEMEDALTDDFRHLIRGAVEENNENENENGGMENLSIDIDESKSPMYTDDIESAPGLEAGLSYDIPDFIGTVTFGGGSYRARSSMSGDIEADTVIEHRDPDDENFADDVLWVDLKGESENDVNFTLNNVSAGFAPELFENFHLRVSLGAYWGSGEVTHKSTGEMEYHPEDVDDLDEDDERRDILEELKKYDEDALLEYEKEFDLLPSAGARLGASYDYELTESLSLRAAGEMRWLSIDFEGGPESSTTRADGTLLEEYYEDEFAFELPGEFEEDLNGAELSLGINIDF